jgi:ribosome-associated protein
MVHIIGTLYINENEILLDFIRGSGPGGQNVNKVASAVQLRFDVAKSASLTDEIRQKLFSQARKQVTKDGVLIIEARRFRSQEANRQDAIERLVKLIRRATQEPKIRRNTKPTRASKTRRLDAKHHRARTKQLRRPVPGADE